MRQYWFWIIWAAVLIVLSGVQFSSAATRTNNYRTANYTLLSPEQIRQMPLLERPNRPGHFYGNTVRWLNSRRVARGYYGGR
ncbi:MAG: hypothetical protein JW719_12995 [Pirellulales bacterium]|nr:hypothetical protein [Pirellulales bacterium]